MVTTRLYRDGAMKEDGFPVEDISDYITTKGCVVWADFVSPTERDLAIIEEELGLHRLAVEDAVHSYQRPKLDRYDTHLFLAAYAVSLDNDTGELTTHEIKAFITPHALVTVHDPDFDMSRVVARWDNDGDLSKHGVGFLLWGLLDEIVDGHFETVQQLDGAVELLEDALFDERPRDKEVQKRSFEFRKSLVLLRRVVLPMREVVNTLLRRDLDAVDVAMGPYFQDVYDHVLRATEWTESLRDLVTTILETNLSIQSNRMNLIMKKVTSWAAIIAVPTAITGFFGQNLQFVGFGTGWGVWMSIGLIAVTSLALYLSFKRRDWL
ncbi:magnesium transporter CorA family protein [Lacisediminihabitans profunda]|uniref:Magnesium transporter CorA family protein n=1 Tax=Lacisediminihabitans profunda TaxID=2594790 RepID=A0A5C8URI7_9MICO|nr:magnesium transporter CorA family protein [Lacisediminihabitans profunda]TXN30079.1 magnesium transporter CorA family protein [Lacisediminihabitans profunda]